MTTLTTADAWLLLALGWSVVVGFGAHEAWRNWRERRRAARRLAASEAAFWRSLRGVIDRSQAAPLPTRKPGVGIYEAADARLTGRLRAELDDDDAVGRWLAGGA